MDVVIVGIIVDVANARFSPGIFTATKNLWDVVELEQALTQMLLQLFTTQ